MNDTHFLHISMFLPSVWQSSYEITVGQAINRSVISSDRKIYQSYLSNGWALLSLTLTNAHCGISIKKKTLINELSAIHVMMEAANNVSEDIYWAAVTIILLFIINSVCFLMKCLLFCCERCHDVLAYIKHTLHLLVLCADRLYDDAFVMRIFI